MKYSVVYADPCWPYNARADTDSFRGGACAKYDLMRVKDIAAIDVASVCEKEAMLFMWCTGPHLIPSAQEVIEGWGFQYLTFAFIWVKLNLKAPTPFFGTGSYTAANAEILLLAKRKKSKGVKRESHLSQIVVTDEDGTEVKGLDLSSIAYEFGLEGPVFEHRMAHSRKPDVFHEKIEAMYASQRKLELFARRTRPGWTCLGNEIDGRDINEALKWADAGGYDRGPGNLLYTQRRMADRVQRSLIARV